MWKHGLWLVAALGSFGCGQCLVYCLTMQTLVFQDASGAPLRPRQVTDGETVYRCAEPADGGTASANVTCTGNQLTYPLTNRTPHSIRAEASTGQVFAGEITPAFVKTVPAPPADCSCGSDSAKPLTLQLTAP